MHRRRLLPAAAAASLALSAGVALAAVHAPTVRVRSGVRDTNAQFAGFAVKPVDKQEAVAIGPAGYAVYTFQGETTHHLICRKTNDPTTNCWGFWPPVSVPSAHGLSKQSGIHGHLGAFHNHGTLQLTLNGQPLYYFTPDLQSGNRHAAGGDELRTFGSIWHLVLAHVTGRGGQNAPAQSTPSPSGMQGAGGWGY